MASRPRKSGKIRRDQGNLPFPEAPNEIPVSAIDGAIIQVWGDSTPEGKYFRYDGEGNIILHESFDARDPCWGLSFAGYPEQPVIVGRTKIMLEAFRTLKKAASSASFVLIQGHSGTGKELAARVIASGTGGPFEAVDCALPMDGVSFEDRLFGRVANVIHGAPASRGFFHLADGGTGCLDNIDGFSLSQQAKLLRVLDHRPQQIRRVGSDEDEKVDVRVIAASNRDFKLLVQRGEFRPDLYFRLNVLSVELPPLRSRKEDIPLLMVYFLLRNRECSQRKIVMIDARTLERSYAYDWPGNVRELNSALESALALREGSVLCPEDLPPLSRHSATSVEASNPMCTRDQRSPCGDLVTRAAVILQLLRVHPGLTVRELAQAMSCSDRTAERFLDPLLDKGVERRKDEKDGRVFRYYVSADSRMSA